MQNVRIAVRAMAHPVSLIAIGLLVVNDHILKTRYPGPLTGKLSDIAGLAFFPLLIAIGLGLLTRRPRTTLWLSIVVTGAWFTSLNTLPQAARATEHLVSPLWQWDITMDATDLLALPALGIAVLIWNNIETRPLLPPASDGLSGLQVFVVIVGAAASLATSCDDPQGVQHIEQHGDLLIAAEATSWGSWSTSDDGGHTWSEWSWSNSRADVDLTGEQTSEACLPDEPEHCFRIDQSATVEESVDGGVLWHVAWQLPAGREEFVTRARRGCGVYEVSAVDLFITGGSEPLVLVAMAHDGLLRRMPDGTWQRDVFGIAEPLDRLNAHISQEWFATVALMIAGVVGFTVLAHRRLSSPTEGIGGWPILGMIMLGIAAILSAIRSASGESGLMEPLFTAGVPLVSVIGLAGPLAVWSRLLSRHGRVASTHAKITIGGIFGLGVVVITPFLAWSGGILATWTTGAVIAVAVGLGVLAATWRRLSLAPRPAHPPATVDEPDQKTTGNARPSWVAAGAAAVGAVAILGPVGLVSMGIVWSLLLLVGIGAVYFAARLSGYLRPAAMTALAVGSTVLVGLPATFAIPGGFGLISGYVLASVALRPPSRWAIVSRLIVAVPVVFLSIVGQLGIVGPMLAPAVVMVADLITTRIEASLNDASA